MNWTSLVAQMVKCLPTMWETWVQSLGQEDLLEKEMATHSILAWKIPWTEEPVRLQSMGVAKTRTRLSNFIHSLTHLELREWTRRFFKDHSCKCILIYCVLSCDKNKWDHQKSLLIETSMFKEVLYWKKRNQDILWVSQLAMAGGNSAPRKRHSGPQIIPQSHLPTPGSLHNFWL